MTRAEFDRKWDEHAPNFKRAIEALLGVRAKKSQIPATSEQYFNVAKLCIWDSFYSDHAGFEPPDPDAEIYGLRLQLFILNVVNAHIDNHNVDLQLRNGVSHDSQTRA